MSDRYAWRIRGDYRDGQFLVWPCSDEATARAEFDAFCCEIEEGLHPGIREIVLQRCPIEVPWKTVLLKR